MSINFEKQPQLVKIPEETTSSTASHNVSKHHDFSRFIFQALTFCFVMLAIMIVGDIASGHALNGVLTGPLVNSMQAFSENTALLVIEQK